MQFQQALQLVFRFITDMLKCQNEKKVRIVVLLKNGPLDIDYHKVIADYKKPKPQTNKQKNSYTLDSGSVKLQPVLVCDSSSSTTSASSLDPPYL